MLRLPTAICRRYSRLSVKRTVGLASCKVTTVRMHTIFSCTQIAVLATPCSFLGGGTHFAQWQASNFIREQCHRLGVKGRVRVFWLSSHHRRQNVLLCSGQSRACCCSTHASLCARTKPTHMPKRYTPRRMHPFVP